MIIVFVALIVGIFIAVEYFWVKYNGKPVPEPMTSRQPQTIGKGKRLTYVVLGDSTAVSQGGEYDQGYAAATAQYLAKGHEVTWVNLAVAGARARDVATVQLKKAVAYRPDIVLIAAGANDVTHLTTLVSVDESFVATIAALRAANASVRIILTGSPDMGTVPRLPQPLRWLAGHHTKVLNKMIMQLAHDQQVVFAPIAEETGPLFRGHPELFASDKFHPNTEGYRTWIPVLMAAINAVLE